MINIKCYQSLSLCWKIGKEVRKYEDMCWNPFRKYALLYTYKFGTSEWFSVRNIKYMEKFYKCFPIYYEELNKLSFEHYKLLVDICEVQKRYFYYRLALFCRSSVLELQQIITSNVYLRI